MARTFVQRRLFGRFARSRRGRKLAFRRRRKVTTRKAVARIARAVVNRAEETKKFIHSTLLTLVDTSVLIYNPMFQLTQGLTMSNFVGQKVQNAVLRVDWSFWPKFEESVTSTGIWQGAIVRLFCIKANAKTGTTGGTRFQTSPAGLTATDIFDSTQEPAKESFNSEKVTVLKDLRIRPMKYTSTSSLVSTADYGPPLFGRFFCRIAKQWQFEDNSTGFGRNRQFYFGAVASMFNAPAGFNDVGTLSLTLTTIFKDS